MGRGRGQASGHYWMRHNHADTTSCAGRWGRGMVCAWGGSDPGLQPVASADAALVAPTPGMDLIESGTRSGQVRYLIWSKAGT